MSSNHKASAAATNSTTTTTTTTRCLDDGACPPSYAIMVHKLYSDRVQAFLGSGKVQLLDTTELTGTSNHRRGYVLLLLQVRDDRRFPKLSPMARQNMAWVGRITHRAMITSSSSCSNPSALSQECSTTNTIGSLIWNESISQNKANLENMVIRVDCHPKTRTEDICFQLQQAALANFPNFDNSTIIDPAYDGPIAMTASASKCTHRLTIVCCCNNDENNKQEGADEEKNWADCYYWGLVDRSSPVVTDLKLNSEANCDLRITPTAKYPSTADVQPNTDPAAPLSRAYYKLHQVWQDRFWIDDDNSSSECWWQGKVGLDLGASPGGWTQVLVHCAQLSKVVAVDAGLLADRVAQLSQVEHVPSIMESCQLPGCKQSYSILVCDASVRWETLLDLLLPLMKTVSWTQPAVAVVTMKLPFKRTGSIQRHIGYIEERLPEYLKELSASMYPDGDIVPTRHYLVHLMANTEQERTLIVHFGSALFAKD